MIELKSREHKIDKGVYDHIVFLDETSTEEDWILVAKQIDLNDKVTKLLTFNELNQKLASKIAKTLNLEYYSMDILDIVYNKKLMRDFLEEHNFKNVPNVKTNKFSEIELFVKRYDYPIVIKPIEGFAGKGVHVIHNAQQLEKIKKNLSHVYVEKFIKGQEYSVETFSYNNKHKIVTITEKIKDPVNSAEIGHIVPAYNINDSVIEQIKKFIHSLLSNLSVKEGITHTELIVNEDGVFLVETHLRLAGGLIGKLIELSFNVDMAKLYSNALKEENSEIINWNGEYSMIYNLFPISSGHVKKISYNPNLNNYKEILEIITLKKGGELVSSLNIDNENRLAALLLQGKNPVEMIKLAKKILSEFEIIIE